MVVRKQFGSNFALSVVTWILACYVTCSTTRSDVTAPGDETVISGKVVDDEGNAIAGATVEWGRDDVPFQVRQRVKTDDNGIFKLILKSLDGRCHIAAS